VTPDQLHFVREAIGVAIDGLPQVADELRNINEVIIDGNYLSLKNRAQSVPAIIALYQASKDIAVYEDAIADFAEELGINVNGSAPVASSPAPSIPIAKPDSSVAFTPAETQTLGDLNFRARSYLGHTGSVVDRLLVLAGKLKDGTWPTWADIDRSYIVSLMGSTDMGHDSAARPILFRFAIAIGAVISDVGFSIPIVPTAPAIPVTPTPVVIPDIHVDAVLADQVLQVLRSNGLFLMDGMFGFGGIDPDSAATVQVFGNKYVGDASIQFTTGKNVATKSLSGDGGLRDLNNHRVTKLGLDAYDPDGNVHYVSHLEVVDPNKHHSMIGTDSKHNPSWQRTLPANAKKPDGSAYAPHEYTQDVVLEINEDEKELRWASYRRGWHWAFSDNAKYGPVRIWRAVMGML
jgi:hypothetical protein